MNKKQNNKFNTSPYGQCNYKISIARTKSNIAQNKQTLLQRQSVLSSSVMFLSQKYNRLTTLENTTQSDKSDKIEIAYLRNQILDLNTQLQKVEKEKLLYIDQNRKYLEENIQLKETISQLQIQQKAMQNSLYEIQFDQSKTYSYLLNQIKMSYTQALRSFNIPSLEQISLKIQNEIVYSLLTHLNVYKFDATSGSLTCNQCSNEPEDDDILLPCHRFHQECLKFIIEQQKNCGKQPFTCICGQVPITPALLLQFRDREFAKELSQYMLEK